MMQRKVLTIFLVLFCGLMFWTSPTWAGCEQSGLAGTWTVEVWGGSTGGVNCWDMCTLTVDADGTVIPGGTYTDCEGFESDVTGGQLTMLPTCVVQGTITTTTLTVDVGPGAITGEGRLCLGTDQ